MRVVSGVHGGRKLNVPKGRDIRPTSDKVRGAIFNTLSGYCDFHEAFVLDAFCGTGALGIEALSRGASHCVFVDKARASLDLARQNVGMLGLEGESVFKLADAQKVHFGARDPFDLVFLDPPYRQGLAIACLDHLGRSDILREGAVCVLETERGADVSAPAQFEMLKDKLYGDTLVTYLRYSQSVA
ncbi:MAG: 16S rRNA (guanine(966)-N(2))-methyltransferase RsmD [Alphaproteobacteria bacterium]|nr:16S rRNA (guanine(966)-N(2))-methyltransferase RsmD [Alphaproteobacteria bacterium]